MWGWIQSAVWGSVVVVDQAMATAMSGWLVDWCGDKEAHAAAVLQLDESCLASCLGHQGH